MKPTPIFYGSIEKAKLKLINPKRFNDYIYSLNGKNVEVTVAEKGKRRTIQSNKYYWAVVVKMICDENGSDFNNEQERNLIHEILKQMFAPKKEIKWRNEIKIVPCSTTELLTTEFSEYIESIKRWASMELNLVIPDPEEIK